MKIIGKTTKGFLVEATEMELAQVDGYPTDYTRTGKYSKATGKKDFAIGDEFPVSSWWGIVGQMREREESLRKMGENLKALGDLVTGSWPQVVSAMMDESKES